MLDRWSPAYSLPLLWLVGSKNSYRGGSQRGEFLGGSPWPRQVERACWLEWTAGRLGDRQVVNSFCTLWKGALDCRKTALRNLDDP